jgi:membrane dipeptidase
LCPVFRNVKDEQIKALAKNGGVICINFYPAFISKKFVEAKKYWEGPGKDSLLKVKDSQTAQAIIQSELQKTMPDISAVADHIDYIVKMVGDDYVGIGADYDGIGYVPQGLEDVTKYPNLTAELKRRGYSNTTIRKILGGNVLRVLKANRP